MFADPRVAVTFDTEILTSGLHEIGQTVEGYPRFLFFGLNAFIVKEVRPILATQAEYTALRDSVLATIDVDDLFTGEILTSVDGPGTREVVDGVVYYTGSLTYTTYPQRQTYNPVITPTNYTTPIVISGYTINGEPIISGANRARVRTQSYETTLAEAEALPNSGQLTVDQTELVTNKSISGRREINDIVYAQVSISFQELISPVIVNPRI